MICEFGDVVVVPFPFVDIDDKKRRPSLILSRKQFNQANGHSICAMITTAARTRWPSDVAIADLATAGLPRPSVVRWKLFTLPNHLIQKKAGILGEPDRVGVTTSLRHIMA